MKTIRLRSRVESKGQWQLDNPAGNIQMIAWAEIGDIAVRNGAPAGVCAHGGGRRRRGLESVKHSSPVIARAG